MKMDKLNLFLLHILVTIIQEKILRDLAIKVANEMKRTVKNLVGNLKDKMEFRKIWNGRS